MSTNVGFWDRLFRFLLGTTFLAWGIAGGPYWTYLGLLLVISGAWGVCPIYGLFKNHS